MGTKHILAGLSPDRLSPREQKRHEMSHVLYIGPDFRNSRGGIAAVLEVYQRNITPFRFVASTCGGSAYRQCYDYLKALWTTFFLLLTRRSIQVVHLHSSVGGSFLRKSILLLLAKALGKNTVFHIHSGNFHRFYEQAGPGKWYIRKILSMADSVGCLSQQWKEYYTSKFRLKHIEILNNVIDPPPSGLPVDKLNTGQVNFLFLGKIADHKGVFDLLEVLRTDHQQLAGKYRLMVAGNGEIDRFRHTVKDYGLEDEVSCLGWISGLKKAQLLQQCDVYILPSHYEGMPVSILEAMSYGKAILSTNVGGIPEIVKPGYNGWLHEPKDHSTLKNLIHTIIDHREKVRVFGAHSKQLSESYLPESVMRSLSGLYTYIQAGTQHLSAATIH